MSWLKDNGFTAALVGGYCRKLKYGKDTSDIDIAVLLKGDVDKFREIERMNNVIYQIVLEYGELVSFYPLSKDEFSDYEWPLHYHIQMRMNHCFSKV